MYSLLGLNRVVCMCSSRGYCYIGRTAGGQLVCVGGSRGSYFSSTVGSLQYSLALWGLVCCVASLNLPLKSTLLLLFVIRERVSLDSVDKDIYILRKELKIPEKIIWSSAGKH